MYKIVALDLDGTLLNSKGEVSVACKAAIQRYENMGGVVALASGRSPEGMYHVIRELGLKSKYHMGMLGNQIFTLEKKYPVSYVIENETRDKIISILDSHNADYLVGSENATRLKRECAFIRRDYESSCFGVPLLVGDPRSVSNAFKIDAYIPDHDLYEELSSLKIEGINIYHGTYVSFFPKKANKFEGVSNIALILGVDNKDILAMGDTDLDREMLRDFGFGIAMANSDDYVRGYADRICDYTNDEDAVARAFYKYIFKEPFAEN